MQRNLKFTKKIIQNIDITKTKHIPTMEYISPLNKKMNKNLIIMIRGHIRDSFQDDRLNQLLLSLSQKYNISVYIHTWNIIQSDKSWRTIEKNDTPVTDTMIRNYFSIQIKHIVIQDEDSNELIGNREGYIGKTECPILCWKNMWYGMNQIINNIHEPSETTILNIRFDIFTNKNRLFTIPSIEKIIHANFNRYLLNVVFISKDKVIGIDNLMLGSVNSMRQLINHFHKDLDSILERYTDEIHQEFIVLKENYLIKF